MAASDLIQPYCTTVSHDEWMSRTMLDTVCAEMHVFTNLDAGGFQEASHSVQVYVLALFPNFNMNITHVSEYSTGNNVTKFPEMLLFT